jgi:hypothetical protein
VTSASRQKGYVGEANGDDVLLMMDVESEATIRARLADDPWANDVLTIESVEPSSVWLRAATLPGLR